MILGMLPPRGACCKRARRCGHASGSKSREDKVWRGRRASSRPSVPDRTTAETGDYVSRSRGAPSLLIVDISLFGVRLWATSIAASAALVAALGLVSCADAGHVGSPFTSNGTG